MTLRDAMARKLATQVGAQIYSRRKAIAEPPFGQIKNRGFRQLLSAPHHSNACGRGGDSRGG